MSEAFDLETLKARQILRMLQYRVICFIGSKRERK